MEWDSSHFRINIARINKTTEIKPEEMIEINKWCLDNKIDCLYYLKNNELDYTFELQNGFSLVDTRVELKRSLKNISVNSRFENRKIQFKKIKNESMETFDSELFLSFYKSRFYQDKKFNKSFVTKMYQTWVENHINAKNAEVISAHVGNQIIGLITYEFPLNNVPKIGLFSVKSDYGKQGIGSQLLKKCILDLKQKRKKHLLVVTQNSNKNGRPNHVRHRRSAGELPRYRKR